MNRRLASCVCPAASAAALLAATSMFSAAASDCDRDCERDGEGVRAIASRVLQDAVEETAPQPLDASVLFDQVVERYRALDEYEDSVTVEQVTARSGELSSREETAVTCEIQSTGDVRITTPGDQVGGGIGVAALLESSDLLRSTRAQRDLWLAPHMALRTLEEPLSGLRPGIDEGFTPVRAETVTVDDHELVRVDLHSGDGLSEDYRARYEFFIDPGTLLIQRVRGVQLLPDGANLLTDYNITPRRVVNTEEEDITVTEPTSIGTAA